MIELDESQLKGAVIPLKFVKFQNVVSLTVSRDRHSPADCLSRMPSAWNGFSGPCCLVRVCVCRCLSVSVCVCLCLRLRLRLRLRVRVRFLGPKAIRRFTASARQR